MTELRAPDEGRLSVAGEFYYQDGLRAAAMGSVIPLMTGENWHETLPVVVKLVPEPENRHDEYAVRLDIDGLKCGYMWREDARRYQPILLRLHAKEIAVTCSGRITGGGKHYYGLYLHCGKPAAIAAAAGEPAVRPRPRAAYALTDSDRRFLESAPTWSVPLVGDVLVTVTGEERHQRALTEYRRPIGKEWTRWIATLGLCEISGGRHVGEPAIEVAMDAQRVGELTKRMSDRYGHLVASAVQAGKVAGCQALVINEYGRGLQVELLLPRV
jgi:hypothetical protein